MYGNVFFGAKVHTIAKIIKIHVAYSLLFEKTFAKVSKKLKIKNSFSTSRFKQERKVGQHFGHKVGRPIFVTNSLREQKKNKVNVCSILIK